MSDQNEALVRSAWQAYRGGDTAGLLALVHPDLEWTYLDPSFPDPEPQTCHGRAQLAQALERQSIRALKWEIEEMTARGNQVMVVLHAPGLDRQRVWQADDRNYLVLTVREGQITAMRTCRDRDEAAALVQLSESRAAPDRLVRAVRRAPSRTWAAGRPAGGELAGAPGPLRGEAGGSGLSSYRRPRVNVTFVPVAGRLPDVRKAYEHLLEQGAAPVGVREVVAESWLRSVAAGVNVDESQPPITLDRDLIGDYRAEHPLATVFPLLDDVLGRAADDCNSVLAIADGHGQLLWVRGRPQVMRRAESIQFVEGAQWDERHAGTNAPGTALRLDAPVAIKSAEHFVRPVQNWSCAAAPVHEPGSDTILGVIDITGGREVDSPQTIAMVRAAARMAESELARHALVAASRYPEPRGAETAGLLRWTPGISLSGLGRSECVVSIGPRTVRLSPRHSEIMVILAACPGGLTGDELAYMLYPADVISSTPRAELVRLRALLGDQVLASRPYRLTCEVTTDWAAISAQLAAGNLTEALRLYRGPLLPRSEAPGVAELRGDLHRALRAATLAADQPEFLLSWTRTRWGADDLEIWQRLGAVLPATSPLRPIAAATAAKLDAEYGR